MRETVYYINSATFVIDEAQKFTYQYHVVIFLDNDTNVKVMGGFCISRLYNLNLNTIAAPL